MPRPLEQLGVGTLVISDEEKAFVNEALNNNRLSYGPFTKRFEREFAAIHGARFAIMSNSGTSALQIALAALKEHDGWQDGDEVIVPAVTFVATANVCLMLNLRPVFVDVDPITYNIDPDLIEEKITARTRAIMPVHLFGLPANMQPIMGIASRWNLRVVEDSCETMFVDVYGRSVGSYGDIACFSTYVAHFLVTGVGGLSITSDPNLAGIMRSLCNHGRDNIYVSLDDDAGKTSAELSAIVQRRFNFVRLGYSYRVTELEGALGCAQLQIRDRILTTRRRNAQCLVEGLKPLADQGYLQLPLVPSYTQHAFMLFPIVIQDPMVNREDLTLFLEEQFIETRPMMPLINQPFYQQMFGDLESAYPAAAHINQNGFYIGCHQGFGPNEIDYIIETFGRYFGHRRAGALNRVSTRVRY